MTVTARILNLKQSNHQGAPLGVKSDSHRPPLFFVAIRSLPSCSVETVCVCVRKKSSLFKTYPSFLVVTSCLNYTATLSHTGQSEVLLVGPNL